jgi:sigma-B regulation protein RsbU (phosphoserine phosphatase)
MAGGDLEATLPIPKGRDEVSRLSGDFRIMQQQLKQHIELNRQAAATQERIESELRIAHSIQMGLLPKEFPLFPDRRDFDLYASMNPAREVGGDFYDFMMPDEDHLWMMIGDVSGKGTPAALFMAVTLTFLRAFVRDERSPAAVLGRVNDELARNNETSMFVTVFCAIIHLPSGRCRIASGGHNPPVVVGANGNAAYLPKLKGAMLGAREGLIFEESEINLSIGDVLFLYTDGVTEAIDTEENFFGNDRLLETLIKTRGRASAEIVEEVAATIAEFAAGTPQYDDIAMAVFRKTNT